MPTVVDSLVLELGFDAKNLSEGYRQYEETAKRARDTSKKAGDDTEKNFRDLTDTATKFRNQIILLYGLFTGGRGIKDFIQDVTTLNASLGRVAVTTDSNVKTLAGWRNATTLLGGSADAATSTIQNLVNSMMMFSITGQSNIIPYFRAMHIALTDASGKARSYNDILLDMAKWGETQDPARAAAFWRAAGADEGTINLLIKGRAAVKGLQDAVAAYTPTKADVDAAQALQLQFGLLELSSRRMGTTLLTSLAPALLALAGALKTLFDYLNAHPALLDAIALGLGAIGTALTVGIGASVIGEAVANLRLLAGAFWGLSAAMTATPFGLVLAGIAAVVAAGYELYENWDRIGKWWHDLWAGMRADATLKQKEDTADAWSSFVDLIDPTGIAGAIDQSVTAPAVHAAASGKSGTLNEALGFPPLAGAALNAGVAATGSGDAEKAAWAAAVASQTRYGIPAEVTFAQWKLESGSGRHMPKGSNNPFGIKAGKGQPSVSAATIEVINGKAVHVIANFRKFASLQEAFDAHASLLANDSRYAGARSHANNPGAFADALTGVYATDPAYGSKLKSIMASSSSFTHSQSQQVNIENFTLNTKATNGQAAAKEFAEYLSTMRMATQAQSGPN